MATALMKAVARRKIQADALDRVRREAAAIRLTGSTRAIRSAANSNGADADERDRGRLRLSRCRAGEGKR